MRRSTTIDADKPTRVEGSFGRALYYPYIHFQNIDWLKSALLYWDGLKRLVVPLRDPPNDDDDVRMARDEGLVAEVELGPYIARAEAHFRKVILPHVKEAQEDFHGFAIRRHYPDEYLEQLLAPIENNLMFRPECVSTGFRAELLDQELAYYMGPGVGLDPPALHRLFTEEERKDRWLRLRSGLGSVYLVCLAVEAGAAMNTPPVTDNLGFQACSDYFLYGKLSTSDRGLGTSHDSVLLNLDLQFPGPEDLKHVRLADIVKFNRHHVDERRRLRKAIEEVSATIASLEDQNSVSDFLAEKRDEVQEAISDHRKALDELAVSSLSSLLRISSPAAMTALATQVAQLNAVSAGILTVAGFLVGFVGWWAKTRQERRRTVRSFPWHYSLSVASKFPRQ